MSRAGAEEARRRAQALLPPGDPRAPAFAAAVEVAHAFKLQRCRALESYVRFLRGAGLDIESATPELTEAWLGHRTGAARSSLLGPLRATVRALVADGAMAADPTAGLGRRGQRRSDRRLSREEFERVVGPIRAGALAGDLVACRDMVAVSLCAWRRTTAESLGALLWGDVDRGDGAAPLEGLPGAALGWVESFRRRLADRGVLVVPEDALLPALGNRVYYDWTARERALLAPATKSAVCHAMERRLDRAGVSRESRPGSSFLSLAVFIRAPEDLDSSLSGPASAPGRIRMPDRATP